MVKKLKKYVKFVVCCALMLSLMAPSYAALSASDGSAFVTKAEFDSALADFNARLTTFEAGINSKIDSQVTSYLDRNGIWSGKTQTLIPLASGWKDGGENAWCDAIAATTTGAKLPNDLSDQWRDIFRYSLSDFQKIGYNNLNDQVTFLSLHKPVIKFKSTKSGLLRWDYCGLGGGLATRGWRVRISASNQLWCYNVGWFFALTAQDDIATSDAGNILMRPSNWHPIDAVQIFSFSGQGEVSSNAIWQANNWQKFADDNGWSINYLEPWSYAVSLDNSQVSHPRLVFVEKDITYYLQAVTSWKLYSSSSATNSFPIWADAVWKSVGVVGTWTEHSILPQWQWEVY